MIQEGNVPCARFGHTISRLDNQVAILFGGITFPKINSIDLGCSILYEQQLVKGDISVLKSKKDTIVQEQIKFEWIKASVSTFALLERAFHTCTFVKSPNKIVIFGGITVENEKPQKRINLFDMTMITMLRETKYLCLRKTVC